MHKRGLCRHAVSVRLSRRTGSHVSVFCRKQINVSSNFFHHRVASSNTVLFFYTKRYSNILRGPLNGGVECRWDGQKSRFSISISLYDVNAATARCYQHAAVERWQVDDTRCIVC